MKKMLVVVTVVAMALLCALPALAGFLNTGSMSTARDSHTATLLQSGKVLVAGGFNGSPLASTELYDPGAGTWNAGPVMSAPRAGHTATLLSDGKVLITGGLTSAGTLRTADLYDPVAGTIVATGNMASPRNYHTATLLSNGKVLIAGGSNGSVSLASAELYDPATGVFSATGTMPVVREGHTATLLANGTVVIFGGTDNGTPHNTIVWFVLETGVFSYAARATPPGQLQMVSPRTMHSATLLANGDVLVVGGSNGVDDQATAEIYWPIGHQFSTGSMASPRDSHTATLLADGSVLITGGWSTNHSLNSAELYNTASRTFSSAGTLGTERAYHTATLLANGNVLIAGGFDGTNDVASAELYNVSGGNPNPGTATTTAISTSGITYGANGTVTVTVSSASSAPTGSVTLSVDGGSAMSQTLAAATATSSTATFTLTKPAAGSHTLSANYSGYSGMAASSANGSLAVAQRSLTVTMTAANKVYDGTTAATVTYSDNRIAGDVFTIVDIGSAFFSDKNVGTNKTVSSSGVTLSGLNASNYVVAGIPANTTATITARPITVTADARTKAAGTADPVLTYTVTSGSLAGSDTFSGALTRVAGETVATYAIQQGTLTAGSNYQLSFVGSALTITAGTTIAEALDATALIWTTGGNNAWAYQTATTHDGADAAQSGGIGHSQATWMETTVTGNGTLTFWWSVSSESCCDYLSFYIDGVEQSGSIRGSVGWTQKTYTITGAGTHTLRWAYTKDGSVVSGADAGWVDQVVFTGSAPPEGTFSATGSMVTARDYHTATRLQNGTVLIAGGYNGSYLNSAEIYNPATGIFSNTGIMSTARYSHSSTILNDGKILIAGGYTGSGTITNSAEIYNPATGTFSSTGSMSSARAVHTATLLNDGRVLITGGSGNLNSAEIYNPATGTFSDTGSMSYTRGSHAATLLNDGRVLITGGYSGSSYLNSAEIYNPATATFSATGSMNFTRVYHTASLLPDGRVLISGGYSGSSYLNSAEIYNVATGTFSNTGNMTVTRISHTATQLQDGKIMIAGGYNGSSYRNSVEIYNPVTGTFIASGSMTTARGSHTETLLLDGKVLITGGYGSSYLSSAEIYTPVTGTFSATGSMSAARHAHTSTLLPDGKVLIAGGYNGSSVVTSAELYNPATGVFSATGSMSIARDYHTAALLLDGKVLITGGYNGSSTVTSAELYNPATGTFSATGSMASARYNQTTTLLPDGKVLIAGGYNGSSAVISAVLYNPATGTFTPTGNMSAARSVHTASLLPDGKVLITGGYNGSIAVISAELYNPATGTFIVTGSMSAARHEHTATLLPDGKVLIVGGHNGSSVVTSAELYNPATGTFSATGSMSAARQCHTATLLPDGKVLITGGYNGSSVVTSAELYNPATGTFSATSSMASARYIHTATLLPDGKVMIAGGNNGSSTTNSAELYTPSQSTPTTATTTSILAPDITYGANGTVTVTVSSASVPPTGSVTLSVDGGSALSQTLAAATATTATSTFSIANPAGGSHTLYASYAAQGGFGASSVYGTLSVEKLAASVVLGNLLQTYDKTAKSASATTTPSGLTVQFTYNGSSVAPTAAGSYTVVGTINDPVYQGNATGTLVISPRSLTASVTGINKVYDGSTTASVTFSDNRISGDLVTLTGSAAFASKAVGNGKAVSVSGIVKGGSDSNNYTLANTTASTTANITAKGLTISGMTAVAKTYDGLTNAGLSGGTLVGVVSGDVVSFGGQTGSFASKTVGTGKPVTVTGITLSGADAGNYTVTAPTGLTAGITAKGLTISGMTAVNKVYSANTSASLTGGTLVGVVSGDLVSFSGQTGSFASKTVGSAKPVTVTGITLSGADAGNYSVTAPTGLTADITAKGLTVSATALSKVYNGNTATTATLSDDRIIGDILTTAYTAATFANKNIGANKPVTVSGISISGADAGNYSLVSTTASATASITTQPFTVTVAGVNKVYDGTTAATVTYSDNRISGDIITISGTAVFSDKNIGTAKPVSVSGITVSGVDAGNYTLSVTTGSTTADITPRSLTASVTGINKVYDGSTTASVTFSDNRISGDSITLTGSAAFASKTVGTGKAVSVSGIVKSGSDSNNYTLANTTASTTANITAKGLTISGMTAVAKTYDGLTNAGLSGGTLVGVVSGDVVSFGGQTGSFASKTVGTGKPVTVTGITLSGADAGNYTVTPPTGLTAGITAKGLTISGMTAVNKVYSANTSASLTGGTLVGVVSGDLVSFSGQTGSFASKTVGSAKPVTVSGITLSGADAGNYSVTAPTGLTADITAKGLTVSATAMSKVYNGNTATTATLSDDRIIGDILTTAYTAATFANKNIGANKPVTVSGISISGADAGNYSLVSTTATTTANITTQPFTVTVAGVNKVYDGTTAATVTYSDNRISGDIITISGTAVFSDKNIGTAKPVSVSGITVSGVDAGNYTLSVTTGSTTADITPRSLTASVTGINKVYDGSTTASVTFSDNRISGDLITLTGSAVFASKTVGNGKAVSVSGIVKGGSDSNNYTLANTTASTTANITAKGLTVSGMTAVGKTYDGLTNAGLSGGTLVGVVSGDVVSFGGQTGSFASKTVGTGKTVTVSGITLSGADAGNYTVTPPTGITAGITAKGLTISGMTAVNKVYTATTAASLSGGTLAGVVSGDLVSFSGQTGSFASKTVGSTKPVTVTGITLSGADAGNYTVTTPTGLSADITAKGLTVSATALSKVYNGNTATTATLSDDRIVGDILTTAYTAATFANKNIGANKPVTVSGISISGADAGNYSLVSTTATTTASINVKGLTITGMTAVNKVYDGLAFASLSGGTLIDVVSGDVVSFSGQTGSFASKAVGTAKPVTVSGITLSGADSANYTVTIPTGLVADITGRVLTVSATAVNKVYDGSAAATVTLNDDRITGDNINSAYTTATFANKNIGTSKTISISGISISGVDAGNYALANTSASTTANITAKELTISGMTAASKAYDGLITVVLNGGTLVGVVNGDVVTFSGQTGSFASKTVGTGKTVTVSGIVLSGADAGNYSVTPPTGLTASIIKSLLTVSANSVSRYANNANPVFTYTINGFVNGEGLAEVSGSPLLATTATISSPTGNYPITVSTGTLAAVNYSFVSSDGVLTVLPQYRLTINIAGGGTVNNFDALSPQFSPCSTELCTSQYNPGSTFLLRATPAVSFTGWTGGGCTTGDCQITLSGDTTITATFVPIVKIMGYTTPYQSLQGTYDSAVSRALIGPVILSKNVQFEENFELNSNVNVTLQGGYSDAGFTSETGYTELSGSLTISNGSLTVRNLILK